MSKIGFIGLGRMGKSMALNLCKKGFELFIFDLNTSATAELKSAGAQVSSSVKEIATECDIVVTMLPSSKEVELVTLGDDGIFANAKRGTLLLDMSTVDPASTERLHQIALTHGHSVVDAPVGRLAIHADRGESLFMVGASDGDFKRVEPLLKAMGTTIYHCGPVGSGGKTKLVNNFMVISLCQMNGEALALSQSFGLDLTKTLNVLYGTSATNGQLRLNFPNKVLANDLTPGFTIDLAHKDMSLVLGSAHTNSLPMPLAASVYEFFSQARAAKFGHYDFTGITDVICNLSNINKPRTPEGWTLDN
ncbi:NAD(P)-dependent oxidoreductase [Pseudomonas sp. DCB_AW]|uniref:NAD(P)-dependent oxidoreductase n=1 Tax=Pseudomonas sp. DCB_AW TaxID=2993596 RepID=UPI00224957D1|nr:NAD(P)-dependent oxidoreductase [Pseudomonas sp. DCB_AW]MCX2684651.1 NAD(P)-dependent oxidoreductase [Pseudomonas sp. DCB_AW]